MLALNRTGGVFSLYRQLGLLYDPTYLALRPALGLSLSQDSTMIEIFLRHHLVIKDRFALRDRFALCCPAELVGSSRVGCEFHSKGVGWDRHPRWLIQVFRLISWLQLAMKIANKLAALLHRHGVGESTAVLADLLECLICHSRCFCSLGIDRATKSIFRGVGSLADLLRTVLQNLVAIIGDRLAAVKLRVDFSCCEVLP